MEYKSGIGKLQDTAGRGDYPYCIVYQRASSTRFIGEAFCQGLWAAFLVRMSLLWVRCLLFGFSALVRLVVILVDAQQCDLQRWAEPVIQIFRNMALIGKQNMLYELERKSYLTEYVLATRLYKTFIPEDLFLFMSNSPTSLKSSWRGVGSNLDEVSRQRVR